MRCRRRRVMGRMGSLSWLVLVIALMVLVPLSEGNLQLKTNKGPVEVILNKNGLLQCQIANLTGISLNPEDLGVLWTFGQGTEAVNVLMHSNGQITSHWEEAELAANTIQNGNMALLLRNVTLKHSGEYKCEVVIPPDYKESVRVKLEVLAQPMVTVVSKKVVEVGNGGEMFLGCHLDGYYPCESNVEWFKLSPSQSTTKLLPDICIAPPTKNPDGTCKLTAEVRFEPQKEDIGSSFRCRVTHKTFPEPYTADAAVTLKEAEIRISEKSIVGSVIASLIISVLLIGTGIFLYMRYMYKVLPKLSDIQLPAQIIHRELTEITCHVSGFRPNVIHVGWYLKRPGDAGEELIGEFKSYQIIESFRPIIRRELTERGNKTPDNWKLHTPSFKDNNDGTYSLSSTVEVNPDVIKDNKVQVFCRVWHPAGTQEKWICLCVDGIAPKLSNIIIPSVVQHNSLVMLTCPINFFKPNHLTITWYRNRKGEKSRLMLCNTGDELTSSIGRYSHDLKEFSFPGHIYSIYSMLTFKATVQEDDGDELFCEVNHLSLKHPAEKRIKLDVKAFPSLNPILCDPVNPRIDKELTLSCKVHSFYPKEITVQWFKDKKVIMDFETFEIIENPDNKLYELTTTCTVTPTLLDIESKYQCQVNHKSLLFPKFVEYIPESLVRSPKINEITCDPVNPEIGEELTLACEIKEFYPEDIQIDWFKDNVRINGNTKYGIINKDFKNEDGLYNKITELTLTSSSADHQAEFRVEAYHSNLSAKPQKQCFQLFLKGSPKFSDFNIEPKVPSYGHQLTVSYWVYDLPSKHFTFEWYKGSEPVKTGVTNSDFVCTPQKTYKVESCLTFVVTAEDFGKELVFLCKDDSKNEFKKHTQLPLKAVPPEISEISCTPVQPKMGGNATLTCRIEHFCPVDIDVVWTQGSKKLKDQQVVEPLKMHENGLYSTITKLPIVITRDSKDFVCEIRHALSKDIVEKTFRLQI
ncbi:uncharacterized protein LOC132397239 isoform X2 [Hypanus sabinus]|nr:uncharacterized protein LOC132397239 isoform X2 [Hypanus sabinus]